MKAKMSKEDFIATCSDMGYASRTVASEYCERNPKDAYDGHDVIEAYRLANAPRHGGNVLGWRNGRDGHKSTINNVHRGLATNATKEVDNG